MAAVRNPRSCVLCEKPDTLLICVTKQGLTTLIDYSQKRSNKPLEFFLNQRHDGNEPVYVHQACRRDFTNARRIKVKELDADIDGNTNMRRSQVETFQWKTHCLFCSKVLMNDDRHPGRYDKVVKAEVCSKKNLFDKCIERGDKWADDVKRRLSDCIDLVASDAVYHKQCQSNFFTNKGMPGLKETNTEKTPGRPTNTIMQQNFDKLCDWHEKQTDLFTIAELRTKMCSPAGENSEVYTIKRMKQKIEERWKHYVFFTNEPGRSNVVCFIDMASSILPEKWYNEKKENELEERERVIKRAADLIRNEVRCTKLIIIHQMMIYNLESCFCLL